MPSVIPFFALTTRGLESVAAGELADLPTVTISGVSYRRVAGTCSLSSPAALLAPRTVDDVFLHLATWDGVERQRATLARLRALTGRLDVSRALAAISAVRPLPASPAFSVTASFVGHRNYSAAEIKDAVAGGLIRALRWRYQPDDRTADLNMRVFVEHDTAQVGLRLARTPLHERCYRVVHRPGALRPTIAAALPRLAEDAPGLPGRRVLDPGCGTGTIVIEAALAGAQAAIGGDLNPDAIQAARTNAAVAGVAPDLRVMDMRALPLDAASVDRVVCNLPWGRQVRVDDDLAELYRRAIGEMHRVLVPSGRAVLLTSRPELVHHPFLARAHSLEIGVFGQTATVLVLTGG